MPPIRIYTHVDSDTLHLPQLATLVGKDVEIVIREASPTPPAGEEDWEALFAVAGTDLVDPDVYQQYREFDRQRNRPPEL